MALPLAKALYAASGLVAMLAATMAPSAWAQDNRGAYDVTRRCFVANVRAAGIERREGRATVAEQYQAASRKAFDAMAVFGVALGKTRSQMEADILASQTNDLPRMVNDPDYFRSIVSACRAYGLMPPQA